MLRHVGECPEPEELWLRCFPCACAVGGLQHLGHGVARVVLNGVRHEEETCVLKGSS